MTTIWIDASAGVAGDMLLGALVDAGAPLPALQEAVDAVVPGAVALRVEQVRRAGLRAAKVHVDVLVEDPPHRTWSTIRGLLAAADLPEEVRSRAGATFERLADAEGRVHGVPAAEVHFHEVGALDAIADVVGTAAGLAALGAERVVVSPVALGSGTVRAHHGVLPVPAPAVLELSRGWAVLAGGDGELATPTGLALVTALAGSSGPLPAMTVTGSGIGAGTRDTPHRANVVRVVLGDESPAAAEAAGAPTSAVLLEANVDDLDPRVWPEVLTELLGRGALDAWLSPVVMKKGRPAHTLHVLSGHDGADALADVVLEHTSTLGVRRSSVQREVLERAWVPVDVQDGTVRVKVGHRDGRVLQAMPEFDDVVALAHGSGRPVAVVLAAARAAAHAAGLVAGASWPR
ncbi:MULTISPECIES: nickel pincer cofactor biosynthesis protein LarC [unclassified Actinotalea]|uniref:nickel pincer cofactor biosynthesis protein LarC n=1 Tax=unclassified Actinotalea TaxID=2638618 RepID=UPI00210448CF|nr:MULTISPECIES: nickel pincer cofactor biosynthesis protein LarC [unclassified Actinotalea]